MRRLTLSLVLLGLTAGWVAAAEPQPKPASASTATADPKSEDDKLFYTLGLFLAQRGQLSSR